MIISGRVIKVQDNISTDHIIPGRYFHLRSDLKKLSEHTLEDVVENFYEKAKNGVILVGGSNFGIGSSREHAPIVLKMSGVKAVVAKSFARIFFRNAINIGLPVIIVDTSKIFDGDDITIDLEKGVLRERRDSYKLNFPPLDIRIQSIIDEGGIVNYIKKHGDISFEM
ncbi:MAG TPA: 3-isopropylmalate dehydratase [Thermodesulfobium narugense]|uniref:3-isopropylmalate dehydratase small subunit n=1 Tax=Thermodesulfobium acidiphilum TaxID=1794699 RepID=A0A2R4W006_THEAF|nr:3-isopropylmalate dehydratase [Thermodesulfobium acidiphilum]AWB10127.1 3-isopropylmalate dehydratase, small subunit [Thermodesulfobium acidiphilum]HEM55315.1 3-isopropylmalate dehydratase [Thermodesulfobium narugense]